VNTFTSKNVGWKVALAVSGDEMLTPNKDAIDFLYDVYNKVLSLPIVVSLPKHCSELSFPRYYSVFLNRKKEIIDIIGVRKYLSPTKWSYKFGYWHPTIQHRIAETIREEIAELSK